MMQSKFSKSKKKQNHEPTNKQNNVQRNVSHRRL